MPKIMIAFKNAGVEGSLWDKLCERAIALYTRPGNFCHTELVLRGDDLAEAECWSSTLKTGTRIAILDLTTPGVWVFLKYECTEEELSFLYAWCKAHQGEVYNKAGIVKFVLPFWRSHKHEMFCSQSVLRACRAGLHIAKDWIDAKVQAYKVSPNLLYRIASSAMVRARPLPCRIQVESNGGSASGSI